MHCVVITRYLSPLPPLIGPDISPALTEDRCRSSLLAQEVHPACAVCGGGGGGECFVVGGVVVVVVVGGGGGPDILPALTEDRCRSSLLAQEVHPAWAVCGGKCFVGGGVVGGGGVVVGDGVVMVVVALTTSPP